MLRKIKFGLILVVVIIIAACSSDKWSNGDFVGKVTLTRINASYGSEKVESDNAKITLTNGSDVNIEFSDNSLMPGCVLKANRSGSGGDDYYTGSLSINFEIPPKICQGNFKQGNIDIPWGVGKVTESNGEIILKVKDYLPENESTHYEYEFRGRRKGWF